MNAFSKQISPKKKVVGGKGGSGGDRSGIAGCGGGSLDLMYITYAFPLRLDPHAAGVAALPLVSSVVLIARSPCAGAAR